VAAVTDDRLVDVRLTLSGTVLRMPRSDAEEYVRMQRGSIVRETVQRAPRQTRKRGGVTDGR